jgi:signal transduction histidine kinase
MKWNRIPIVVFLLILIGSLGGTIFISMIALQFNTANIQQLIFVMALSGIVTTLIAYGLYRTEALGWFTSIFWTMALMVVFTVGVILINVWFLTRFIFMNTLYLNIISTVLIFGALGALSFGYFISKSMSDRLSQLAEGAAELAKGKLSTRLEVKGNDEIAQLTASFNEMAQELHAVDEEKVKLETTRRNLVAWVSHDLRTPMASMRLMMEAINDGMVTDEETFQRYLAQTLNEINNLDRLVDDLFELAQLDIKDIKLDYQPMSLSDLISDTVSTLQAKAQRKNIMIEGKVSHEADLVNAAPEKIQRVIANLVDNAIKYTPEGGSITIGTKPIKDAVEISVVNVGVTVPKDQLPRLFDSFYRGESSRRTTDGERGTGLGLAIARGFIEAHGGTIWATSEKNITIFTFTLPHRSARSTGIYSKL